VSPGRRAGLRNNIRNLTICIVAVLIILLLKNMSFSYAERATVHGIKSIITREYDLGERLSSLRGRHSDAAQKHPEGFQQRRAFLPAFDGNAGGGGNYVRIRDEDSSGVQC
jgi:hypothetical protein